jgi:hypothetical protein
MDSKSIIERFNKNLHQGNLYNDIRQLMENFKFAENIITNYNDNIDYKNPHIDPFFEITFILSKYFKGIFRCISSENNKKDISENKQNMLRLFDFVSHNFKSLRNKYEDLSDNFFNCDEEHFLLYNIRKIYLLKEFKTSNLSDGFVNILFYYTNDLRDLLNFFSEGLFVINNKKEIKKFDKLVSEFFSLNFR